MASAVVDVANAQISQRGEVGAARDALVNMSCDTEGTQELVGAHTRNPSGPG